MVRFTPNGWSVISRQRLISLVRSSGVGWVSAVRTPSAPAFDTAEASSAVPTHCIPPCTIGYRVPSIFVIGLLIELSLSGKARRPLLQECLHALFEIRANRAFLLQ